MKRAFFFLFSFVLQHISGQAMLSFDHETVHLGKIPEGPSFEILFQFKNVGKSPLIISNVQSSCGCVVASWPKNPILPNETGTIVANFLSKGHLGRIHKNITVISNDTSNPSMPLFFKCEVVTGMNLRKLIFTKPNSSDTLNYTVDQKITLKPIIRHTQGILLDVNNTDSLPVYLQINDFESSLKTFWSLKRKTPHTLNQLTNNWNKIYFKKIILQPHSKQSLYFKTDPASKTPYTQNLIHVLVNETTFEIQIIPENK